MGGQILSSVDSDPIHLWTLEGRSDLTSELRVWDHKGPRHTEPDWEPAWAKKHRALQATRQEIRVNLSSCFDGVVNPVF